MLMILEGINLEEGRIHVELLGKSTADEVKFLSLEFYKVLPPIKLTSFLMEILGWTSVMRYFCIL